MKKLLLVAVVCLISFGANAQAKKYLNLGGIGTGLYGGLEFPVGSKITVGPVVYTDWDFDFVVFAAKGNFYFDDIFELNEDWDVYAGANVGFRAGGDGGANWGAHIGGRWFWSEKWGLNAEFGGGSGVNGGVGVTKVF